MSAMCRRAVDTNAGFEEPQFHFMFKINVFRNRTTPSYLGSGVGNTPASVDGIPTSLKPPAQPIRVAARPRSKRKGPRTKQRRNKYSSIYSIIMGQDTMHALQIDTKISTNEIIWEDTHMPMVNRKYWSNKHMKQMIPV